MTALRRFDLFSRSIFEIFEEYEHYKKERPNLIVDDHLLITYPFAIYLFANKLNAELASTIEAGLRTAYKSGEIQELLLKKLGKNHGLYWKTWIKECALIYLPLIFLWRR